MSNTLDEEKLIRHIDVRRTAKLLDEKGSHLAIMIEHMDGTEYEVSVNDRGETPEYLTILLVTVGRGADMMFRALDILRTAGYVDTRPVALLGREIIFGLNRVALELEITENSNYEISYGISVTSVDRENAQEVERVLEENGIDVI